MFWSHFKMKEIQLLSKGSTVQHRQYTVCCLVTYAVCYSCYITVLWLCFISEGKAPSSHCSIHAALLLLQAPASTTLPLVNWSSTTGISCFLWQHYPRLAWASQCEQRKKEVAALFYFFLFVCFCLKAGLSFVLELWAKLDITARQKFPSLMLRVWRRSRSLLTRCKAWSCCTILQQSDQQGENHSHIDNSVKLLHPVYWETHPFGLDGVMVPPTLLQQSSLSVSGAAATSKHSACQWI